MKRIILLTLLITTVSMSSIAQRKGQRNYEDFLEKHEMILFNAKHPKQNNAGDMHYPFERIKSKNNSLLKSAFSAQQRLDSIVVLDDRKEEFIYDSNGNMAQSIVYNWDSDSNSWKKSMKWEYTYDSNGFQTQFIVSSWDSGSNTWNLMMKEEYTYDSSGNMTQLIIYYWDPGSEIWIVNTKHEYTYDSNGNMTQSIGYNWDSGSGSWIAFLKYEQTYDSNGNITQFVSYLWDSDANTWKPSMKYEYTYDSNGNNTQFIRYNWDSGDNSWVVYWKYEQTFDSNGNMTQLIRYSWDINESIWIPAYKQENVYDNEYALDDLLIPFWYQYKNKLLSVKHYSYDDVTEVWIEDSEDVYYYSDLNTAIQEAEPDKVRIYPNPVSDELYFNLKGNESLTFELYDLLGKKLMHYQKKNGEKINLSHLNSGTYIYKISIDGLRQSGKLIKK